MAANDNAPKSINPIEGISPRIEQLKESKEILLANAVMLGEIPAPTFAEEDRIQFLANPLPKKDYKIFPLTKPVMQWGFYRAKGRSYYPCCSPC